MIALRARYVRGWIDSDLPGKRPCAIKVRSQIEAASSDLLPVFKDRLKRLLAHAPDAVLGIAMQGRCAGDYWPTPLITMLKSTGSKGV
jgi:hypothetical protein